MKGQGVNGVAGLLQLNSCLVIRKLCFHMINFCIKSKYLYLTPSSLRKTTEGRTHAVINTMKPSSFCLLKTGVSRPGVHAE